MYVTAIVILSTTLPGQPGDLVLLDFSAAWCAPCQQMAPVMQRLVEEGYPVQRIDVDRYRRLAEQWNVGSIPCYILVRDGKEVERLVGAASFDRLVTMFETAGFRPSPTTVRGQSPTNTVAAHVAAAKEKLQSLWMESPAPHAGPSAEPSPTGHSPYESSFTEAEERAARASVRIRVEEPNGRSFGSGTIIHTHENEALIVTCGHLFRESQGKMPIFVDILSPQKEKTVPAQLLTFDAGERDLALLTIRLPEPVTPAELSSDPSSIQPGSAVFSLGCDRGGPLRVMRAKINSVDRYVGKSQYIHTIQASGDPVDGRSGGGLFDQQGRLIGVCYAADPSDVDEGLYMGVKTIKQLLDEMNLSFVYQQSSSGVENLGASVGPSKLPNRSEGPRSPLTEHSPLTERSPLPGRSPLPESGIDHQSRPSPIADVHKSVSRTANAEAPPGNDSTRQVAARLLQLLESSNEVMWVVKPHDHTAGEVLVLDPATRTVLLERLRETVAR